MSARTWENVYECDDAIAARIKHDKELAAQIALLRRDLANDPPPKRLYKRPAWAVWTPESIRGLRNEMGLTQVEMAIEVGVSTNSYSAWEAGKYRPTRPYVRRLTDIEEEFRNR